MWLAERQGMMAPAYQEPSLNLSAPTPASDDTRTSGHSPVSKQARHADLAWTLPPDTMVDPSAWDRYWQAQLEHGMAGFVHLFCDDKRLVDHMRANGLRTILCIGNGISQEPRALAWAGFDVTALDLSPLATTVAQTAKPSDRLFGDLVGEDSSAAGGRVTFVTGDVCDTTCCPGPYDVIIERLTLQLYLLHGNYASALEAAAGRLSTKGIFFSQFHQAMPKGGTKPVHPAESWFTERGWLHAEPGVAITGRVAWLFRTTG